MRFLVSIFLTGIPLYCIVLYCIVLYCIVLYCIVLYRLDYCTTRKVVGYAEKEQIKREAAVLTIAEDDDETKKTNEDESIPTVPKIRYIRLSDLSVVYDAWHLVPVLANTFRSLIFRYHELSEQVLEESTLLDTMTIRPGDVVDEERDPSTTWVQVTGTSRNLRRRKPGGHHHAAVEGRVPSPHLIGRDDVAALVVAAALFPKPSTTKAASIDNNDDSHKTSNTNIKTKKDTTNDPIHYTVSSCRNTKDNTIRLGCSNKRKSSSIY